MQNVVVMFVCLACACDGRRALSATERVQSSPQAERHKAELNDILKRRKGDRMDSSASHETSSSADISKPLKSIGLLLLASNPSVAFSPFAPGTWSLSRNYGADLPMRAWPKTKMGASALDAGTDTLLERALLAGRACSLAFVPPSAMPYEPYASDLKCVVQVEDPSSQAGATVFTFAGDDGQEQLLIACRGSSSVKNFQTNLDIGPVALDMDGGSAVKVHAGFQRAARGLWELIKPHLPPAGVGAGMRPLLLTGHSLGGGTATLVALHLHAAGYTPELITLAGPRLGDAAFARYFRERCPPAYHLVHDQDEVLSSNTERWDQLGFEHVGRKLRCSQDSPRIYNTEGNSEKPQGPPSLRGVFVDHCAYLGLYIGLRLEHPAVWFRSPF